MGLSIRYVWKCDICGAEKQLIVADEDYHLCMNDRIMRPNLLPTSDDGWGWRWVRNMLVCDRHKVQILANVTSDPNQSVEVVDKPNTEMAGLVDWKLIDSAPDDALILVGWKTKAFGVIMKWVYITALKHEGKWYDAAGNSFNFSVDGPIYWKNLPSPPEVGQASGRVQSG